MNHDLLTMLLRPMADAYAAAPEVPNGRTLRADMSERWAAAASYFGTYADMLRRSIDVDVQAVGEPYADDAEMFADIDGGHFTVSNLFCDHPLWTPSQNVDFRIYHDHFGHYGIADGFDRMGEYRVWAHSHSSLPTYLRPVLFSESMTQLAFSAISGEFGAQKVSY
jgi:hypothetical protein